MNCEKLFQTVVFILYHNNNCLDYYNLNIECYVADRISIDKIGFPITGDRYLCMHNGPVLEELKSFIENKNCDKTNQREWNNTFIINDDKITLLNNKIKTDKLSEFEEDILQNVCKQFNGYSYKQMKDYVHKQESFPEWIKAEKSELKIIKMKDIMNALNFSKEDIHYFITEQETFCKEEALFNTI